MIGHDPAAPPPAPEPWEQNEAARTAATLDRMADLLTRTANVLKGEPGPLMMHDWSDLPEVAAKARQEGRDEILARAQLAASALKAEAGEQLAASRRVAHDDLEVEFVANAARITERALDALLARLELPEAL